MIKDLTLRAGTLYCIEQGNGTLSERRELEKDTQADLLASNAVWRVYQLQGGQQVYVRPEDDAPVPTE